MLPEKAGNIILGEESRRRLDSYYRRYCEGENNRLYGLSHIVYACHVSFPLVLTPEIANLVWLNFRIYPVKEGTAEIDRVVVSDFLLSPLVRTVAAGQFEIIPDIRNYLLYLLRNGKWFSLFGIGPFGDQRITDLAVFLEQYLQRKKDTDEAASMFRQANEWATKAYLNPDDLAVKMATALNETFDEKTNKRTDEYQQLYINTLVNRFGEQLESGIHAETVKSKQAFLNLQLYSNANNALLFGKPEEADAILMKLGKAFIGESSGTSSLVNLPLGKTVGERLERKKNNVQKVRSLLIGKETNNPSDEKDTRPEFGIRQIKNVLQVMNNARGYDTTSQQHLTHLSNKSEILRAMTALVKDSDPEDTCLIYFAGYRGFEEDGSPTLYLMKNTDERGAEISKKDLTSALYILPGSRRLLPVLILDIDASPDESFFLSNICLYATRPGFQVVDPDKAPATAFSAALEMALGASNYKITYGDLQRYMQYIIREVFQQRLCGVVLHTYSWLQNNYFLSNEQRGTDNRYVIAFNAQWNAWRVLEEDFTTPPINLQTNVYNYADGLPVSDVRGEMFRREGVTLFNGRIEALMPTFIYKAEPVRPALPYELILPTGTEPLEGNILNAFAAVRFDKFSKWGSLEFSRIWKDYKIYSDELLPRPTDFLLLHVKQANGQTTYNMSMQESHPTREYSSFITADLPDLDQLAVYTEKFLRFYYLTFLEHSSVMDNYLQFRVAVELSSEYKSVTTSLNRSFIIEENAFEISDGGELTLRPFTISFYNEEIFPLFFDVYLLFPDLTIYLVERDDEMLPDKVKRSITLDDPNILKKIADTGYGVTCKILFSRHPMQLDFSQEGVNS